MIHDGSLSLEDFVYAICAAPRMPAPFYWNGRWYRADSEPMSETEARDFLCLEPSEELWVES